MPNATADKKSKDKALLQQAGQPPATAAPPEPLPLRRMMDHEGYAAASAKLAELQQQAAAVEAEAAGLRAELGDRGQASPIELEALALIGQGEQDAAGRLADKLTRLEVQALRGRVLARAVQLQEGVVAEQRSLAAREVMRGAGPEYRRLLILHVEKVLEAARSRMDVCSLVSEIDAEVPATSGGLGDYSFTPLGDLRRHEDALSVWLANLVFLEFLRGDEPFLTDVRMIAQQGGKTVVDRPSRDPMTQGPPAHANSPGVLGAVGAAIGRGMAAVAGLVGASWRSGADADDLPPIPPRAESPPGRKFFGGSKASPESGAKTIRLLKDMATAENEWSAGWTGPWAAADAASLVKHGVAEWADAPTTDPLPLTEPAAPAAV